MLPFFNIFSVICICAEVANLDTLIWIRPAEARLRSRLLHVLYASYIKYLTFFCNKHPFLKFSYGEE